MFGGHYYHAILRKSVSIFGTLFNDINIIRKHANDSGTIVKVPLAYGPKQKFLARIDEQPELTANKIAIKLPRMSFEITSLDYDSELSGNKFNTYTIASEGSTRDTINYVPYTIGMQLNIMVKNQDEGLQVLEQIIPMFPPTYTVSAKLVEGLSQSVDVPVTLNGVSIADEYEGDFEGRRVLVYTLDFSMKVRFFGGAETREVIKVSHVSFFEDDKSLSNGVSKVNPLEASEGESHTITTDFNFIAPSTSITIDIDSESSLFQVGEFIVGDTSGIGGVIESIGFEGDIVSLTIVRLDGYYQAGETITGNKSGDQATIDSYTVN